MPCHTTFVTLSQIHETLERERSKWEYQSKMRLEQTVAHVEQTIKTDYQAQISDLKAEHKRGKMMIENQMQKFFLFDSDFYSFHDD